MSNPNHAFITDKPWWNLETRIIHLILLFFSYQFTIVLLWILCENGQVLVGYLYTHDSTGYVSWENLLILFMFFKYFIDQ